MKLFCLLLLTGLWSARCLGQADTTVAATDSAVKKASLTVGASYSNNANYYGQKAAEQIPYAAVVATCKMKSGLYITGLAYKLLHDSSHAVSAASAGAGFGFNISPRWSVDLNYSHTFYPSLSPLLQAGNPDNANASLQYENWLNTKLNVDYAFGKTSDLFITLGTGKQITLGHISSKDIITLTPSVDVVAGTQHFYQTYITQKNIRDSILYSLLGPLTGQPAPPETAPATVSGTQINILSYNVKCPLAYNRSRYMIELAYQLSVLSHHADSQAGAVNSFVSASFYYQF